MSRLIATTADEMLSGTNSNVMGTFFGSDDEVPGEVVLGSTNMMPNPDLVDVNERGRLRGWALDAPPSPDSWNVYMRQLTTINSAGAHVQTQNGPPMLRQNTSLIRWKEHTYNHDQPLLTDKSLPDLSRDEPTDLAPVLDKPRVKVVTQTGNGGYPAGSLWCSYFGIIGDNPIGSKRITNAAPAVQVTGILQGQSLTFYLPDELPDSWTGVGFCAGPTATTMRSQKRVDIRGKVITQVVDKGPYRRDGTLVIPTSENRTKMGSYEQLGKPRHWRANSNKVLRSGNYPLAYQLKTQQGWTASSDVENVSVNNDQEGEVIVWAPAEGAVKKPGIERWRPLFKAQNDNWYTFEDAKANGYPLNRAARINTRGIGEKWRSANAAKKIGRSEVDHSGIPGPTDPMEAPTPTGAEQMKPGRYAVRLTTANGKLGMESRPSPRTAWDEVVLRDAGLNAGGAASFVTDQFIRVFRPAGQTIKNSRLVEVDPADGSTELHWEKVTSTGVTVGDGVFSAISSTGTGPITYRRSSIEPVDITRYYSLRLRMTVTSITSSTVSVKLRFLSSENAADLPGSLLGTTVVEDFTAADDRHVKYTFGPVNGSANYDMPVGTKFVQAEITGNSAGTRVWNFSVSNIGLFLGRVTPRKVYDLVLAEDTPHKDVWPVSDTENAIHHYPAGPYIRVLQSPSNPATHRTFTLQETHGFETGSLTSNSWLGPVTSGGAAISLIGDYAISGSYGARLDVVAASAAYNAYISKSMLSVGRAAVSTSSLYRVKTLPSTGNVNLLGITRAADATSFLGYAEITSAGAVRLQAWNGTTFTQAVVPGLTITPGDDLYLELSFTGVKTAGSNGAVTLRARRNDRPAATATVSLQPWSTLDAHRVVAGFSGGTTGATCRVLMDKIRFYSSAITEGASVPGNMVEYWAPEGQPAGDPDHFMTGIRYPVKPSTTYVDSAYIAHDGITTPADGADAYRLVSFDTDGEMLSDHGFLATGLKGKRHWDRHSLSYTTPANAAYVEYTRNRVGDGLIWAMGFQHEVGTTPTAFINTNALSGTFNVIFDTTLSAGPLKDDVGFTDSFLRMRAVTTHVLDANGNPLSTVALRARGAWSVGALSSATWQTSISNVLTIHKYVEVEVTLTSTTNTTSPEVRAVFIDAKRVQPVLLRQDGRDFYGGVLVYQLTPATPVPNVVRKELADGSVAMENIGRGKVPEKLKLSLEAFTEAGKRGVERNVATEEPHFQVEANGTRYEVLMVPEFEGNTELRPDGTEYWDYTAEGVEAIVVSTEDL